MTPTYGLLALAAVAATVAIDVAPVAAQYAPWCVQYLGRDGGSTCTFHTYEQCMMTATPGTGGLCYQNPWYGKGPGQGGRQR